MIPRFILFSTAAVLLVACDRNGSVADSQRAVDLERQRQSEQAANEKIRQLEGRLDESAKQKTLERENELAEVKVALTRAQEEKEQAAEKIRNLESQDRSSSAEAVAEAPRGQAVQADVRRLVEEEEEAPEPVYTGRVVPETQRVVSINSFYQALDSQGDWLETDDYGYVFRPNAAARRDWRPYTEGRWVYTDFGWTWESNEEFGWATYHYGRWARVSGVGWVWVPGKEWAPAWVSWRRGDDHYGWAPLPPDSRDKVKFTATVDRDYDLGPSAYIFVSLANFGARSYAPVVERPERNVTIINKTVNITNITYQTTNDKTVVFNGGPRFEQVRARSQQPVEKISLSFAPQTAAVNPKRMSVLQGTNLQLAAPPLPVANVNAAPPRVKQKLGKPKMDKGWEGVETAQAVNMKQSMAATSQEKKGKGRRPAGDPAEAGNIKPAAVLPVVAAPATSPQMPATQPFKSEKSDPAAPVEPRKRDRMKPETVPVTEAAHPPKTAPEVIAPKVEKAPAPVALPASVVPPAELPKKSDPSVPVEPRKRDRVKSEMVPVMDPVHPTKPEAIIPKVDKAPAPVVVPPTERPKPVDRSAEQPLRPDEGFPVNVSGTSEPRPGEPKKPKRPPTTPPAPATPKPPRTAPRPTPAQPEGDVPRGKREDRPARAVSSPVEDTEKAAKAPVASGEQPPAGGLTPEEKAEKKRRKEKERAKQDAAVQ